MNKNCENWLKQNKAHFGSRDGLPGDFHREFIYNCLGPRDYVAIETPHGSIQTGRIVMKGPAGWVACDDRTGGARPLICTPENTVWCTGLYFKKEKDRVCWTLCHRRKR